MTMTTGSKKEQETDSSSSATSNKEKRSRTATVMLVLLACACLVMGLGCLALWHQSDQDRQVDQARDDARAAAQSEAKDLLSYNFRTLDYDLSKAKSEMTPGMAKSFTDYWNIFRPSVEKSQTQALTQVQVTGVTDATTKKVDVVLFVKMISVNAAHKEPQVDTAWPRLTMRKIGKKWLIDGPRMTAAPPGATQPTPGTSGKPSTQPSAKPSGKASKKP